MLQGREINLLFLSPAPPPGIEPGSAGVRLQCFTHRPRRPYDARQCQNRQPVLFHSHPGQGGGEGLGGGLLGLGPLSWVPTGTVPGLGLGLLLTWVDHSWVLPTLFGGGGGGGGAQLSLYQ